MFGLGKRSRGSSAHRRQGLRRNLPKPVFDLREALSRPEMSNCLLFGSLATLAVAALLFWSLSTPKASVGQIAADSRLVRIDYRVADAAATRSKRDEARRGAPRLYAPATAYLGRLRTAAEKLPAAVAGRNSVDGVDQSLLQEFALTDSKIAALQAFAPAEATRSEEWARWCSRFFTEQLLRNPLLDPREYQVFLTTQRKEIVLADVDGAEEARMPIDGEPIATDRPERPLRDWLERQAEDAGVDAAELIEIFIAPILRDPRPTLVFDEARTAANADALAAAVPEVMREMRRGDVIYLRGDRISEEEVRLAHEESVEYLAQLPALYRALVVTGLVGLSGLLVGLLCAYLLAFYPHVCRRPMRLGAIFCLVIGLSALSLVVAIEAPWVLMFAAAGSCLASAIIFTLAYDQRMAIFVGGLQCLLAALLLELGPAMFVALLTGMAAMVIQLREVRHRGALVRASLVTGVVLAIAVALAVLVRLPGNMGLGLVIGRALWAGGASVVTGFLMLGILPTLERLFDITTGLTLAELRDPKQPLLRQLQQKAPGTYQHSLTIANIAEAAADAIGADGLLVFVGALYHDIGKMNKPDYFVENQGGGPNKHDKLSPAMSLLVIVGHVKDGIELAREYRLPRRVRHFIESHHGTTLVEYFYQAARNRAEAAGDADDVSEIAFRYPGPKPQTREAAILMIADAVESATRAMAEPNPSRIENLVRSIGRKRLDDGQFDECDLTLRDLTRIEDSLIKSLCAIYHGRISYPGAREPRADAKPETKTETLAKIARSA